MGRVIGELTMSLDGFIALPDDSIGPLFDWYDAGDVHFDTAMDTVKFNVTEPSAKHIRDTMESVGALVSGRRVFDYTDGWRGLHPFGVPTVVVTHRDASDWQKRYPDAPFTFNDSVEDAVAQAKRLAGDKDVGLAGPNIIQQCLNLGLLDEVRIDLAPVLLGEGIPFFANIENAPVLFDDPKVIEGTRVTHLYYRVTS